jgi:hypothetical protein
VTDSVWVRTYRPDPRRFDERPAILSGGYITADEEDLIEITTASLVKRGHVVLQRYRPLDDLFIESPETRRFRDAVLAEERR